MYKPVAQRKNKYTAINQRTKNIQKEVKKPFAATKAGIAINTILGIPKAALEVGKDIAQTTARTVASVGMTTGNLPTQIKSKYAIHKKKEELPFGEEVATQETKVGKFLFGEKPVKTLQKTVKETQEFTKPYIGEKASKKLAFPLVGLGVALDLSGFGGSKSVKSLKEIPEQFLKKIAKESKVTKIEPLLKEIKIVEKDIKPLAKRLSETKTVTEVKDVINRYTPIEKRVPLNEIIKKEPIQLGAKTVEAAEKPLTVYRAMESTRKEGLPAMHISTTKELAQKYGKNIKEFKILPEANIVNINDDIAKPIKEMWGNASEIEIRNKAKELGIDAIDYGLKDYGIAVFNKDILQSSKSLGNLKTKYNNIKPPSKNSISPIISPKIKGVNSEIGITSFRGTPVKTVETNIIYRGQLSKNKQLSINETIDNEPFREIFRAKTFATNDKQYAKQYGENILEIDKSKEKFLDLENPKNTFEKDISTKINKIIENQDESVIGEGLKISEKLQKNGYSGFSRMYDNKTNTIEYIYLKEPVIKTESKSLLPTVIQGETFTMGPSTITTATAKTAKTELKATQKEIKTAQVAQEKAAKLEAKEQKVRQTAMENIQRFRGKTDNITTELKNKNLSQEDIDNIVLEDGTKLIDTVKVKRNNDGSLSTVITKKELDDIAKNYTDEIPKEKWQKNNMFVSGKEIPINILKSVELPYVYFERKGLSSIYNKIIEAGRDSEVIRNGFIKRFKDAGLFKEGSWFTANRFNLSNKESESIGQYYLGRQGRAKPIELSKLSPNAQKFIKIFDGIIDETTEPFYQIAKRMGKNPGVVENYAPIMTREDIKLIDEGGGSDWLFRKHPSFFSLKERAKHVSEEIYEKDYRKVATRWLESMGQFLGTSDTTNNLKYLINSDEFANIVKKEDLGIINKWLQDITTPSTPSTMLGAAGSGMSKILRKGVALGSLGLNYATVLKQSLTQIPLMIIEKAPPKLRSQYAKAFGINVSELPSISKRTGDIAISDLQGKIGRIFTGAISKFDKINAQASINGLLDKQYKKYLKEGIEVTPEIRKVIEKNAQDKIDMWFGGFFKGQRPEAYRSELGNFLLMFTYPLTSQTNGLFRHILKAKGFGGNVKAASEVLAAAVSIAYMEKVISNLSFEWSDTKEMTKDILVSLAGNIPMVGDIAYSISTGQDMSISPVIGNINNIVRNIGAGEGEKVFWNVAETAGLPKQVRRIKEGMEIMEEGGITDSDGKMLAPVQGTIEYMRAFLRGKYGPLASQDYIRNMGADAEDRRWFYPEVEFLQNAGSSGHPKDGSYERKAEIYKTWDKQKQIEMRNFLSENQQKKLDKALKGEKSKSTSGKKSLSEIFK